VEGTLRSYPDNPLLFESPVMDFWALKNSLQLLNALGVKTDDNYDIVDEFLQSCSTYKDNMHGEPQESVLKPLLEELIQDAVVVLQLLHPRNEDASIDEHSELVLEAILPAVRIDEAESDAVMIHQQDLQEAIMRSKADAPAPICYDNSVVVLRLRVAVGRPSRLYLSPQLLAMPGNESKTQAAVYSQAVPMGRACSCRSPRSSCWNLACSLKGIMCWPSALTSLQSMRPCEW